MKTSTNLILAATLLGTIGLGIMIRWVNAAQTQAPVAIVPEPRKLYQSVASGGDSEIKDDAKEQAEEQQKSLKLKAFAKITPQQAQKAAEASQVGKSSRVKLENEDGNLVYAVVMGQKEVKVDAGNGKVLYTEVSNQEDQKNDTLRPRSSIQVSEASGGDGDGENNDDS